MPTQALYHWSVAGAGIDVLVDLALVDLLRAACTSSTDEIGGILLGHFDGKYTVVTNFEAVESEHRRGTAYTLSKRDESRMGGRLEARRRNKAEVPVGYFRSHLRPGLFLDEGDNNTISSFFPNANQVALLVRPAADRTAVGGFFFWEDGEMNRKQTYLPFPMSSQELETGDFPLVEPVSSATALAGAPLADCANLPFNFGTAETLDADTLVAATLLRDGLPQPHRQKTLETRPSSPSNPDRRRSWQMIAVIAAAAAFGGYLIGTSGSNHDRFGSRAGDITLNSQPEPLAPAPPKPTLIVAPIVAPQSTATVSAAVSSASNNPAVGTGAPGAGLPVGQAVTAMPPKPIPVVRQTPQEKASAGVESSNALTPNQAKIVAAKRVSPQANLNPAAPINPQNGQQQPSTASDNWQHFHPAQPTSASEVAAAEPPPAPAPEVVRPVQRAPIATSSVSLEAVEAGSVSRALSKIPVFSAFHHSKSGSDFTPPQAVRSAAPAVPADLARELTGTLPVDLRLKVDSSGHVSSVEILSHQTAAEFVRLAGDAAYDWQFQPARLKDKAVSSDVIAHFKFRPAL